MWRTQLRHTGLQQPSVPAKKLSFVFYSFGEWEAICSLIQVCLKNTPTLTKIWTFERSSCDSKSNLDMAAGKLSHFFLEKQNITTGN